MKHSLIFIFWSVTAVVMAQPAIERQVTASQGGSDASSRIRLDWTVGEPAVTTLSTPSGLLTQGFQQPALRVERVPVLPDLTRTAADIRVAPNPTAAEIHISFSADTEQEIWLELSDMQGKPLYREKTEAAGTRHMDISAHPPGLYLLRCVNMYGEILSLHRIVKTK